MLYREDCPNTWSVLLWSKNHVGVLDVKHAGHGSEAGVKGVEVLAWDVTTELWYRSLCKYDMVVDSLDMY